MYKYCFYFIFGFSSSMVCCNMIYC